MEVVLNESRFWTNVKAKNPFIGPSDIASITGTTKSTASRWISKNKSPSAVQASAIAKALGCSLDDLLDVKSEVKA